MSADPDNEYFSDGITEEIINALTRIPRLKVIARTSSFAFKNQNIDIRTIGRKLGVSTILEGSVRRAKNRVRITAQLINAGDGTHFWSKNYNRELEDIFHLQDEISELIADQIRENFGHLELPFFPHAIPTSSIEAYELLMKGNYFLKRKDFDDIRRALELFKQSIQLDPQYSEAYSALGEAYIHAAGFGMLTTREAHELARQAAEKAVALKEQNAQGHKVLAFIRLFYDWDWEQALAEYEKAVANGLPDQNEFITYYYIFIEKDYDRAIRVAQKAVETDPLHVITHWQLGLACYFARRFEKAADAFSVALDIDPGFGEALRFRGLVRGYLGRFEEALKDINQALELSGGQGLANLDLLVVKLLMGQKEEVLAAVNQTAFVDSSDPAFLYALMNRPDEAIFWLEKAYEERSVMLVSLKNYWIWDNIRQAPRFQEICARMNFPATGNSPVAAAPGVNPDQPALLTGKETAYYLGELDRWVRTEELFADPALSLRSLAEKMALHPNKLSWLLNEQIGKNFNEYINGFRLEAFKVKALDPANSHLTLLGLAYDSGFNSKTVFNASFKKMEGMTPRAWVKIKKF